MKEEINRIIQRVSEIMRIPIERILSDERKPEVVRCRAMIVELANDLEVGPKELGRYLNVDHSTVCYFRAGNRDDKWKIKDLLQSIRTKLKMKSDHITFTHPGSYNYLLVG